MLLHVIDAIGIASANLVEFRGIRPRRCTSRIYSDNVTMTLHNVTLTSHKTFQHNNKFDCSKTNGYKLSLRFSIKYRYSDILFKST